MKYGIDYKDEGGHTALMYSVLGNQTKICESLINMGADVNATDNANLTALFWAVYHARPEIIKILLRNGADVHITDPHGRSVSHWVMKTPNALCLKVLCKHDMEGLTPLHWAVMCEQHQHISTLLSCVPTTNVCAQDRKGRTPLNYAVLLFSPICIKAILESRPIAATFADFKGRTTLHYACAEGSVDCVRALLACKRQGADRGQRDASDMTPLDHANQRNHTECIKLLESYGWLRQSSSWSIASQFSIHPPTPPELDEHGHVPMKRPSSSTDQQLPQDIGQMNPADHCRYPADGHSNSTQEEHHY
uniref:Uncharacterized protein n=1 Tax=Amphimedon queenslandica TaxID=400682 RepID=A0A1X7TX49_AMPQE